MADTAWRGRRMGRRHQHAAFFLAAALTSLVAPSSGANIDVLPRTALASLGDVNIGAIGRVHEHDSELMCDDEVYVSSLYDQGLAHAWAVEQINQRDDLLPNITLGYVVLDDCGFDIPGVARALQFANLLPDDADDQLTFGTSYDVIGVVGPATSPAAVVSATIYGFFEIPQITASANSDDLSDRQKYPYFFRLTFPINTMMRAMAAMLQDLGWTYFSVLYYQDSFGYDGLRDINYWASEYDLCMATSIGVGTQLRDWSHVIDGLRAAGAKAVITILYPGEFYWFSRGLEQHDAVGEFIFMLTDCISSSLIPLLVGDAMPGSIWVHPYTVPNQDFIDYVTNVSPDMVPGDPWIREMWEAWFGCSWEEGNTSSANSCTQYETIGDYSWFQVAEPTFRRIDAVYAFAAAIDAVIRDRCPEAFLDPALAKTCVTSRLVADYLYTVSIERPSGLITFSETGDFYGALSLSQLHNQPDGSNVQLIEVATFDTVNETFHWLNQTQMTWYSVRMNEQELILGQPESVCSYPCDVGQIYLQGELVCCWECYSCRDNEIVVDNATACEACPDLMWPNEASMFTDCRPIEYSYLGWSHPYGISLLALASVGVLLIAGVSVIWIRYRHRRVVKGSSRELAAFILSGATLGFLTVPTFIAKPTQVVCTLSRIGFNLTLSLLFAPLFIKTLRIYRIFQASSKLHTRLRWIGSGQQVILAITLNLIEIILIVVSSVIWVPEAEPRMPVPTTEYVELVCTWEVAAMLIPLSYNLFLLLLCALFGFLTRSLPDNFNESWYIFIAVCTTSFLWLAFISTYFSAFYGYHKAVLLALAIILNVAIVIICLFVPKIYALWFVDDNAIKISNFNPGSFESPANSKPQEKLASVDTFTSSIDVPAASKDSVVKSTEDGRNGVEKMEDEGGIAKTSHSHGD